MTKKLRRTWLRRTSAITGGIALVASLVGLPAVAANATPADVPATPTVEGPITGPGPIAVQLRPGPDGTNLDDLGYSTNEYFVSGTAAGASYKVRMIVRTPSNPADSSGVVVYEPTHTSGYDLICQFAKYGIGQRGHTCVGVSARPTNLTASPGGLQTINPERYASLHVAANQTNEVLAQIALLLKSNDPASPLAADYPVDRIVMGGTSDSSNVVRGYMALHNTEFRTPEGGPIIDGFLVTSTLGATQVVPVDVPTIQMPTQTEVTNTTAFRRPDGDTPGNQFRLYEPAGMAHNDTRDQPAATFEGCLTPLSSYPFGAVTFMALQHLIDWTYGVTPPHGQSIEVVDGKIVKDEFGNAVGGVRSPFVDVPISTFVVPNGAPGLLCTLAAREDPADNELLRSRYDSADEFVAQFLDSVEELTAAGWWPEEYTSRYGVAEAQRRAAYVQAALDESPDGQAIAVTVPLGAGSFVWSVDGSNGLVDLGVAEDAGDHWEATGSINPVRVTDTRTLAPGWSLSASVSDFASGGASVSGKYLGWTPSVSENTGGAVAGAAVGSGFDSGDGLSVPSLLGSAESGHAAGSSLLGADLVLKLPADVDPGTYSATLTLTALS